MNEWGVYEYVTVESGDTLSQIAYDIYGDASLSGQLAEINGIGNPNRIKIGQTIITPGTAPTKQRNYNDMNDQVTVTHDVEIAIIITFVPGYRILKPITIGATSNFVFKAAVQTIGGRTLQLFGNNAAVKWAKPGVISRVNTDMGAG